MRRRPPRGAALLLAMVVVTVVASLAGAMVWQQWRVVQAEEAERARSQAHWVLTGALDWGRLILREDARGSQIDHLGEPWAVPLQEARLSTFLADGREDLEDSPALQSFVSGTVVDAQSRFNLRNLVVNGELAPPAVRALQRVCEAAGVSPGVAERILSGVRQTWMAASAAPGTSAANPAGLRVAPLSPERLGDLIWWGVEPRDIERLRPWLIVLPTPSPLNVNTATAEVMAAVIDGLDGATAQRIVQTRNNAPLRNLEQVAALLPAGDTAGRTAGLSVQSNFFELQGRLRLGARVFEERLLVERRQLEVVVLQRERPTAEPAR